VADPVPQQVLTTAFAIGSGTQPEGTGQADPRVSSHDGRDVAQIAELGRRLLLAETSAERLQIAVNCVRRHLARPAAAAMLAADGTPDPFFAVGIPPRRHRDVERAFEELSERAFTDVAPGMRTRLGGPGARIDAVSAGAASIVVLEAPTNAGAYLEAVGCVVSGAVDPAGPVDMNMRLAWTAHELRSPIVAVRAAVEQALAIEEPSESRDLLERTLLELSSMSEVVEALLRWGSNPQEYLDPEVVDLVELVRGTTAPLGLEIPPDRVVFVSSGPVEAWVDPEQFRVALMNLVRNAIAHAGPEPITVSIFNEGENAIVAVEDDGAAAPARLPERLFEPFVRGHDDTSRVREGAGLGLFICRSIVEAQGGTVVAERGDGGTAFRIELPRHGRSGSTSAS